MATVQRKKQQQKVVFELRVPKENGSGEDVYQYYVPRLSSMDLLAAQKIRAQLAEDDQRDMTYGSFLLGTILERLTAKNNAPKLEKVLEDIDEAGVESVLDEVVRLATTDTATLASENQTIEA